MPLLELLVTIVASCGNILLGILTYLKNPKSDTNRFFGALAIIVAIYITLNYLAVPSRSGDQVFLWVKSIMSVATLINLIFLMLASSYPRERVSLKSSIMWFAVVFTIVLFLSAPFNLIFQKVEIIDNNARSTPGLLMPFFLFQTISFLGSGFYLLINKYKKSEGREKIQIRLFFIGAILMFSMILITNLLFVIFFDAPQYVSLLPLYTLIFIGFVSYSVVKHGLFDFKVFATQAVVIVLWLVFFAQIFVAGSSTEKIVDIVVFLVLIFFGILLIHSVSNEIEQKTKLRELYKKLEALDKQKDEFLSMAAHELRAPMTAIKGYVSMVLEGDTGDIPEKARGFLADTNNITDRLIRLVNNMLNVSRIEEGRLTFQEEVEYLSVPVRSVFNQFVPEAERKGLKYTLEIPKTLRDKVKVDPDRVQEVIGNFISNAVKYTDEGFVKVRLIQKDDKNVRLEVVDSGPGISKEEQRNLFQKFHRVESNVGKTTGTGLGLYISKLLVEKFGGKLGVESEFGKGSNFWVELPLSE